MATTINPAAVTVEDDGTLVIVLAECPVEVTRVVVRDTGNLAGHDVEEQWHFVRLADGSEGDDPDCECEVCRPDLYDFEI